MRQIHSLASFIGAGVGVNSNQNFIISSNIEIMINIITRIGRRSSST